MVLRSTLYKLAPEEFVHTSLTARLPALVALNPAGAVGIVQDLAEPELDWADAHWWFALLALTS